MPNAKKEKLHTWILLLLGWIFVLLCVLLGFVVFKKAEAPATSLADCKPQVDDAVARAVAGVQTNCLELEPVATPEIKTVTQNKNKYPGFSYPYGWTAFGSDYLEESALNNRIILSPVFFNRCTECDRPPEPIDIRTEKKDSEELKKYISFEAYLNAQFSGEAWSNLKITKTSSTNGTFYEITVHFKGMWESNESMIIFEGETMTSTVTYRDYDSATNKIELDKGWEIIKNSLDFSQIE